MNGSQGIGVNSIAAFEDKLFVCGDGVYYYDTMGNPVRILDKWCDEVIVDDNKLFVIFSGKYMKDYRILYTDLTLEMDFTLEY